ncbi:hypothetical protein X805_00720 [Sphaerotilus natans subsp. natans DSM 6575]|uniref:Uncharacterized protein n=1 Tax=Sphaerotilus natans subsp. natans DSM 6575 TaxID=1286631 RepID=A0A059KS72_9BURK|nr:hypothetical protein X805_00720 [Sphaerotilus natans subsp. natans DSM 6575]
MHAAQRGDQADALVGVLQRVVEVDRGREGASRAGDPDRVSLHHQVDRPRESLLVERLLQLLHAGDAAAQKLVRDLRLAQAARAGLDDIAQPAAVVAARRDLRGQALAKELLHLGEAAEAEVLGEAHHRRGLHPALRRHVLDAFKPEVVAVRLDMAGDQLELAAEVLVLRGDAVQEGGHVGRRRHRGGGHGRWTFFVGVHRCGIVLNLALK